MTMLVEQVWTNNAYRNFHYLVACPETGEALAIDPLEYQLCLDAARRHGWTITQILNTHEHGDHTGGNEALVRATGAKVIAHSAAANRIAGGIDRGVYAGDVVKVGKTVELLCLDTPGHTMCHICLLSQGDQPALFSGDTLFNAGAGNCHHGGHPDELYRTFDKQLHGLGDDTLVYPGHDYLANNLRFTLDREPDNKAAAALLEEYGEQDPANAYVTTVADERNINTFFRLQSESVIERLREAFPAMSRKPEPREVFLRLRELRNMW